MYVSSIAIPHVVINQMILLIVSCLVILLIWTNDKYSLLYIVKMAMFIENMHLLCCNTHHCSLYNLFIFDHWYNFYFYPHTISLYPTLTKFTISWLLYNRHNGFLAILHLNTYMLVLIVKINTKWQFFKLWLGWHLLLVQIWLTTPYLSKIYMYHKS